MMSNFAALKNRYIKVNNEVDTAKNEYILRKKINSHFKQFMRDWNYSTYFIVGGYGSSKSYHIALKIISKLLEEKRTCLVVREVYETMRESCYSLFEEIIDDLNLEKKCKIISSPMKITFKNGSKIIFKGMDKPQKLKSINNVSIVWIEECSEIKYEGFKELLGRLRHPTLRLHMILSTNPVSKSNWCYKHFFKLVKLNDDELYDKRTLVKNDTYYHHSVVDDNRFAPKEYIKKLDEIKVYDLDLYRIARKGRFGVNGEVVLPQFEVWKHDDVMQKVNHHKILKRCGMDFGFKISYNAVLRLGIDDERKILYIYWEYYKNGITDDNVADELLNELGFRESRDKIIADSAEPETIKYFSQQGLKIYPCHKTGPGGKSRLQNTKKIKRFHKIICSDKCYHTIDELKDLTYKKNKDGEIIEDQFNIDPHTFSSIWYALDDYNVSDLKHGKIEGVKNNIEQANGIVYSNANSW